MNARINPRKTVRRCLIIALCTGVALGQQRGSASGSPGSLSKGTNMGKLTIRPMVDDTHAATFSLWTSWLPGENHKGVFRYRVVVAGEDLAPSEEASYIKQLNTCQFTLTPYDTDSFKIRDVPLKFDFGVTQDGTVYQLQTNELAQMDLTEYRSFLAGHRWIVSWDISGKCHS